MKCALPRQPVFLATRRQKEQRAFWPHSRLTEGLYQLEQPGDAGGIVIGAVVDAVPLPWADPDVVDMRGEDHILAAEPRVGAYENPGDIRHPALRHDFAGEAQLDGEARERPPVFPLEPAQPVEVDACSSQNRTQDALVDLDDGAPSSENGSWSRVSLGRAAAASLWAKVAESRFGDYHNGLGASPSQIDDFLVQRRRERLGEVSQQQDDSILYICVDAGVRRVRACQEHDAALNRLAGDLPQHVSRIGSQASYTPAGLPPRARLPSGWCRWSSG